MLIITDYSGYPIELAHKFMQLKTVQTKKVCLKKDAMKNLSKLVTFGGQLLCTIEAQSTGCLRKKCFFRHFRFWTVWTDYSRFG